MKEQRDTRFRKGQSGNPHGRPRKASSDSPAFKAVFDQKQVIKQNGIEREATIEEALQLRTLQAALNGDSKAIKMVFEWILEREAWRSSGKKSKKSKPDFKLIRERDSDNAFEAMCLLGIASRRENGLRDDHKDQAIETERDDAPDYGRISLAGWAIQLAFDRVPSLNLNADLLHHLRMHGISTPS